MRKLSPLLLVAGAALVVGARLPSPSGALDIIAEPSRSSVGAAAMPAPAPAPAPAPVHVEPAGLEKAVRMLTSSGMVYLPRGWHSTGGVIDVVIHFHGAPQVVEPELDRAGIHAALLTVNLGLGSGAYESSYADAKALDRALEAVRAVAAKAEPGAELTVGRVALSSWSAGYGAVSRVLSFPAAAARVDTVLLADSLHAALVGKHEVDPRRMAPFVALAEGAARGAKLFAITHSAIPTFSYANTTETADYLLARIGALRAVDDAMIGEKMHKSSSAAVGDFRVQGFDGADKEAHCQHLRNAGTTLFPLLATRWGGAHSS